MAKSERPVEYDVPHWALPHVKQMREEHKLSPAVTDRMIYARLVDTQITGSKRDQMVMVKSLEDEVRDSV